MDLESTCASISTVFGILPVSSAYGLPIEYRKDNWPDIAGAAHLPKEEIEALIAKGDFDFAHPETLPSGGKSSLFLFSQMDEIAKHWCPVNGYLKYQGILNIALKIHGNDLLMDFFDDPDFVHRFFTHVAATIGYLDTGMHSDLVRVKQLFPDTRRAVLYTPGELESKTSAELNADLTRVAKEYAPCDVVLADVETTVSDSRVIEFLEIARSLEGLVSKT